MPESRRTQFAFCAAQNADLLAIKMNGTLNKKTEVHILRASDRCQSFALQKSSVLDCTELRQWAFCVASNRDLFAIKMNGTPKNKTELHVLSAASDYYQSFVTQKASSLEATTPGQWAFCLAPNRDLFAIKMNGTPKNKTEVHVLSAASDYQSFVTQKSTALHATTAEQFAFGVNGNRDLLAIKLCGNGTEDAMTEVHVLSAITTRLRSKLVLCCTRRVPINFHFARPTTAM